MAQPSPPLPSFRNSRSLQSLRSPTKPLSIITEVRPLPSRASRAPISVYDSLLSLLARGSLEVLIPECMVKWHSQNFPVVFYTENEVVKRIPGLQAFSKFFELVDIRLSALPQKEKEGFPRYVIQSRGGAQKLCMTQEECVARWDELGAEQYIVRRYVRSKGQFPKVYRVNYRQGRLAVFKLRSGERIRADGKEQKRKTMIASKMQSIYQHSPTDFQYACKLHRDSFSPYMPYASKLSPKSLTGSPKSFRPFSPESETHWKEGDRDVYDYIVNTTSPGNCRAAPVDRINSTLEAQVRKLIASIERIPKQLSVEETTLDFIKTGNGSFLLVDCDLFQESSQSPRHANVDSIRSLFQQVSSNWELPKVELISPASFPLLEESFKKAADMHGENMMERLALPRLSDLSHAAIGTDVSNAAVQHLSAVEEKYDNLRGKAKHAREVTKNLVSFIDGDQSHRCQDFVQRVVSRAAEDEMLKVAFRRKSEEMRTIETSLLKALQGDVTLPYSAQVRQLQSQMPLTASMISAFHSLAKEETISLGLPSERQDAILSRLEAFMKDFRA